ncbi:hypothetical protein YWS52_36070 [Chitiniphilus shinanonensis]
MIADAGGLAYILAKFAALIWVAILSLMLLALEEPCSGHQKRKKSGPTRGRFNFAGRSPSREERRGSREV